MRNVYIKSLLSVDNNIGDNNNIDVRESYTPSLLNNFTKNRNFWKENISNKVLTKNDLIKNVTIPSYEPFNLTGYQNNSHLLELFSKRPSFIPTPSSDNWYALLKDFDHFKIKIRCKVNFYDTSNKTEVTNDELKPLVIKSQSNKVDRKCKIPQVETFLSRIEQDIFRDTLRKKYKSNISRS